LPLKLLDRSLIGRIPHPLVKLARSTCDVNPAPETSITPLGVPQFYPTLPMKIAVLLSRLVATIRFLTAISARRCRPRSC